MGIKTTAKARKIRKASPGLKYRRTAKPSTAGPPKSHSSQLRKRSRSIFLMIIRQVRLFFLYAQADVEYRRSISDQSIVCKFKRLRVRNFHLLGDCKFKPHVRHDHIGVDGDRIMFLPASVAPGFFKHGGRSNSDNFYLAVHRLHQAQWLLKLYQK